MPLEADFPDEDELRDEIRITVLHELGHYFGLDEDRLVGAGLRVTTALELLTWAALGLGVVVVAVFLFARTTSDRLSVAGMG